MHNHMVGRDAAVVSPFIPYSLIYSLHICIMNCTFHNFEWWKLSNIKDAFSMVEEVVEDVDEDKDCLGVSEVQGEEDW